jgi:hypothetical protein
MKRINKSINIHVLKNEFQYEYLFNNKENVKKVKFLGETKILVKINDEVFIL